MLINNNAILVIIVFTEWKVPDTVGVDCCSTGKQRTTARELFFCRLNSFRFIELCILKILSI